MFFEQHMIYYLKIKCLADKFIHNKNAVRNKKIWNNEEIVKNYKEKIA